MTVETPIEMLHLPEQLRSLFAGKLPEAAIWIKPQQPLLTVAEMAASTPSFRPPRRIRFGSPNQSLLHPVAVNPIWVM